MTDLALAWNPALLMWDLALNPAGTDLAVDDSLYPAVIVSLLTHRLAELDDRLPDGSTGRQGGDRRGYWGDAPLADAPDTPTPDRWGSRLWLLSRATQVPETLRLAEDYAAEALAWMTEDGIADQVIPTATFPGPIGAMNLSIAIVRGGASTAYDVPWGATIAHQATVGVLA